MGEVWKRTAGGTNVHRVVVIDNYDSFVFNLSRYFRRLGCDLTVARNDQISLEQIRELNPDAIVISPGPKSPADAGISTEVVKSFSGVIPILGICLGHQAIGAAFGQKIVRAPEAMHGRVSKVHHRNEGLFAGLPTPFTVCRYHSLIVDIKDLSGPLVSHAETNDGIIMAIGHKTDPTFGIQFHPEAILTEYGFEVLANFLSEANRFWKKTSVETSSATSLFEQEISPSVLENLASEN